jgi:hypothetical protein
MAGDKGHRQNKLWENFGQNGHNGQVLEKTAYWNKMTKAW